MEANKRPDRDGTSIENQKLRAKQTRGYIKKKALINQ